jgi:hypothetical protein
MSRESIACTECTVLFADCYYLSEVTVLQIAITSARLQWILLQLQQ